MKSTDIFRRGIGSRGFSLNFTLWNFHLIFMTFSFQCPYSVTVTVIFPIFYLFFPFEKICFPHILVLVLKGHCKREPLQYRLSFSSLLKMFSLKYSVGKFVGGTIEAPLKGTSRFFGWHTHRIFEVTASILREYHLIPMHLCSWFIGFCL